MANKMRKEFEAWASSKGMNMITVGELPEEKAIIPPEGGWRSCTYYVVEVSFNPGNPIHRAILYVGFFPGLKPPKDDKEALSGGYTTMFHASWEGQFRPLAAYYLKVISEIREMRGCP